MTAEPGRPTDPESGWRRLDPIAARWHAVRAALAVPLPLIALAAGRFLERRLDSEIARIGAFVLAGMLVLGVARTIVWSRRFRFRLTDTTVETRAQVLTTATATCGRRMPLGERHPTARRYGNVMAR